MKTQIILTHIAIILLLSNCVRIPKGYEKYQIFDEYSLQGINTSDKITEPFVAVKSGTDTIQVLVCERFRKKILIHYVNKGNYWHSKTKHQLTNCNCDTTPQYYEKFIFNDTIITYTYSIYPDGKLLDWLNIYTPTDDCSYSTEFLDIKSNEDKFEQLKQYISHYKDSVEIYDSSKYQKFTKYKKLPKENGENLWGTCKNNLDWASDISNVE
ncbi:MAG: hypothetical protein LBV75_00230 [Paludibacter sp.]|jgi:hypothetical protein|nr:hypothetical protein [Paludibacter sp.]